MVGYTVVGAVSVQGVVRHTFITQSYIYYTIYVVLDMQIWDSELRTGSSDLFGSEAKAGEVTN